MSPAYFPTCTTGFRDEKLDDVFSAELARIPFFLLVMLQFPVNVVGHPPLLLPPQRSCRIVLRRASFCHTRDRVADPLACSRFDGVI